MPYRCECGGLFEVEYELPQICRYMNRGVCGATDLCFLHSPIN